jgi:hypothetical protein
VAFTGARERRYGAPSWVPDWSQKLNTQLPKATYVDEKDLGIENAVIEFSNPLVFERATENSKGAIEVDGNTGSLQLHAVKLCKLSGQKVRVDDQTKILMDKGQRGILIVSLSDSAYKFVLDYVFLLKGWDHPVILRSQPDIDSSSFVSTCALTIGQSSGSCFLPWSDSANDLGDRIRGPSFR